MTKETARLKVFNSSDALVSEAMKRTPAMESVDRMFLDRAREALRMAGYGALEFLAANPEASELELARRLNRGVSAVGLLMAIYDEAAQARVVREIAKDLLTRRIRDEFPAGWTSQETPESLANLGGVVVSIGPVSKLVGWLDVGRYGGDPRVTGYARGIIRDLGVDHPPPEGWKPELQNDPLIDRLFDLHWPINGPRTLDNRAEGEADPWK